MLGSTPRATPYHFIRSRDESASGELKKLSPTQIIAPSDANKAQLLISSLRGVMADYSSEAIVKPFQLDPRLGETRYTFYDDITAQMEVYVAASRFFDAYVFAAVVCYLAALATTISLVTRGWQPTLEMFKRQPRRSKQKSG